MEKGLITAEHMAEAMALKKSEGIRLDKALVRLGCVSEEAVLRVIGEQIGMPMVDLDSVKIDVETLRSLPAKLVYRKHVVPVARDNGHLTVATCDPYDLYALDEIRLLTGMEIKPALATEQDITRVIKTYYGVGGETLDEMMSTDDIELVSDTDGSSDDLLEMAQEASVIKLVNEIFMEALHERASDIHIEPYESGLSIRYRIDGVLQDASVPAQISRFQAAII